MSKAIALGVTGATISAAMLALGFAAGSGQTNAPAADATRAEEPALSNQQDIETVVHEYLLANPQILVEMQTALQAQEEERQRLTQQQTIRQSAEEIFDAEHDGIIGNPEGNVTVVEFFDYNCGYCKRALADMEAMVAADPELRFVLKELPILGPDSQAAHVVSMAFRALAPEKYGEFHRALLGGGRATEAAAIEIALAQGVDEAALREEMKNPAIAEAFGSTYQLADRLSITGTPSYVVGNEVVFGALGQDVLEEKVELVRNN